MGPTFNKKRKKKNKIKKEMIISFGRGSEDGERNFKFFFIFKLLSSIHGVPTVGFRQVKQGKFSTRRGLCVGTKNTGFHKEFR